MFNPVRVGKRTRFSYASIKEVMEMPHLLDIQRNSYNWFINEGLAEILKDISPISDFTGDLELFFKDFSRGEPKYSLEECKERDVTYAAPIKVNVNLVSYKKNPDGTKEIQEVKQQSVFMGDFPLMTETGTFIINGAERVIVSQLVRSPGAYYARSIDTAGKALYNATVIPNRGAWIELETDSSDIISVRIDRTRKMPITYLLRAFGYETNEQILELFDNDKRIQDVLELNSDIDSKDKALIEIYRRLRPGEPATVESSAQLLYAMFFDPKRYDLATVGRYKITQKLGWKKRLRGHKLAEPLIDKSTGEILIPEGVTVTQEMLDNIDSANEADIFDLTPDEVHGGYLTPIKLVIISEEQTVESGDTLGQSGQKTITMLCSPTLDIHDNRTVCVADVAASVSYMLNLIDGIGNVDDIDHLGNRRVRSVGELLQNQYRIGLARMERVVRERMTIQDSDIITPQILINIRPVVAAIKEFFGSSQLSQFMDQHNPLSELTHKRRLSALGPGGLSRERAGFEVRDVHNSHYGRMCPIETPEGPNIGLIGSLSNYARINQFGFIETPYRKVKIRDGVKYVSNEVVYLTADQEQGLAIAQANEPLGDNDWFINDRVTARFNEETMLLNRDRIDFMDVSPKQVVSIATAMIPFLENDDANRALMGANMQRQAVPLLRTQAPLVGTGMEYKAACDSGVMVLARNEGTVVALAADYIDVRTNEGTTDHYKLQKFVRSNQGTCINQTPIVDVGEHVEVGQPIADGPATDHGELALGYNIIVAYMPWEGYNYEDAILLNENLIKRDIYTSIHIEEYECEARDTKLGSEEITRDIPNVGEDALKDLTADGIIAVGADVRPGDILVGKVTPKGETELTAEERLLRAIFGEKAREVRDTSLRVPHGEAGKIVAVREFDRESNDELSPGVNRLVRVYIAQKRKISVGDKMSGRHGNKGVVSRIMRQEDMPFLPDGTPVDIVLNPLGVPSRMNIGQILETHLGMAARQIGNSIKKAQAAGETPNVVNNLAEFGYDVDKNGIPIPDKAGLHLSTPVFDGASEQDVINTMVAAGMDITGKTILYDGRTGEPFENPVTVGCVYMLKLHHLVDDKIHARSTGPYSLVTQQPLGGKAQFGGQRFGEMEVWALEAYGASYTLQEILTVKSDDVVGRVKAYEAIVKGENIPEPGVPESFKVLIKELQSIGLDIKVLSEEAKEIAIQDEEDDDDNSIRAKADNLGIDVGNLGKTPQPPQADEFIVDEEPSERLDDYDDDNNAVGSDDYQEPDDVTDEQIIAEINSLSKREVVEDDINLDDLDSSVDSNIDDMDDTDGFNGLKLPSLSKKDDEE
ncbi:MAG: DNA-directed RNA polymerase subunit beta [Selenomonadaceae bacterium]|nr:DNA-directed RNA polymerase subunit beta [Selenomonadaceae bacterium]